MIHFPQSPRPYDPTRNYKVESGPAHPLLRAIYLGLRIELAVLALLAPVAFYVWWVR